MKVLIACCDDFSINTYNLKSGARVLPPIIIEDLAASLGVSEKGYCMVLTRTGLLYMWDLEKCTNVINRASIRSLLNKNGKNIQYDKRSYCNFIVYQQIHNTCRVFAFLVI